MTLEEFRVWALSQGSVAKFNDNQFEGECVSLINQYCWRVLGIPADAWGHAAGWAENDAPLQYFDIVSEIQPGDILVYKNLARPYGHIEIALGNNRALQQNRYLDGKVKENNVLEGYTAILRKKEEDIDVIQDNEHLNALFRAFLGRNAEINEAAKFVGKIEYGRMVEILDQSPERLWAINHISNLQSQLKSTLSGNVDKTKVDNAIKKAQEALDAAVELKK